MSQQVLQYKRSVEVYPSDITDIPSPYVVVTGTADGSGDFELNDSTALFLSLNINVGDIVHNAVEKKSATITRVVSDTQCLLNDSIFGAGGPYIIYRKSESAPVLSIQGSSSITVITEGGDVYGAGFVDNTQIIPVRVTRLMETGTILNGTPAFALW